MVVWGLFPVGICVFLLAIRCCCLNCCLLLLPGFGVFDVVVWLLLDCFRGLDSGFCCGCLVLIVLCLGRYFGFVFL